MMKTKAVNRQRAGWRRLAGVIEIFTPKLMKGFNSMEKLENRIMQVSAMIGEHIIESMLKFRNSEAIEGALEKAIAVVDPTIKILDTALEKVIDAHHLTDALINHLRAVETDAAYAVGIVAGMHLAGRADLVAKFAESYERNSFQNGGMWRYDLDGERDLQCRQH